MLARRSASHRRVAVRVLALVLALSSAATGCGYWEYLGTDDPEKAAAVLEVTVPPGAREVASFTAPPYKGNCTDLSFLLPTDQWKPYVARNFRGEMEESFSTEGSFCTKPRPTCEAHPAGNSENPVEGQDFIRFQNSSQYRALLVIPECFPGQTLISWMTGAT